MSKHTPGPWSTEKKSLMHGHTFDVVAYQPNAANKENGMRVIVHDVPWRGLSHGEQEANARLIAAAPELLEAARLAENAVAFVQAHAKTDEDREKFIWALGYIREAIRKAEGK